ncbi:MAG: cupin domain-containing protein [Microthrixaceae bacterium]
MVQHLGLEPHPEGGWYTRTWTAPGSDERAAGSSILYLLPADAESRWHRIDATELWQHAAGAPIELSTWADGAAARRRHLLGPDLLGGEVPQAVIEPAVWQSARSTGAWSLAVCVVVPEFRFEHFELADEGWAPPR